MQATEHFELEVLHADALTWTEKKPPKLYVEFGIDGTSVSRTKVLGRVQHPLWNEKKAITIPAGSSALRIAVKHRSPIRWLGRTDPLIGETTIPLSPLYRLCNNTGEISLELNPTGTLSIRLKRSTTLENAKTHLVVAKQNVEASDISRVTEGPAVVFKTSKTAVETLGAVLNKMETFVRVMDSLAKAHPYVDLAWTLVTALHKMFMNQLETDQELCDLLLTIEHTFQFAEVVESLPERIPYLEAIITRAFHQTAEVAIFIREYTGRGFSSRAVAQLWNDKKEKIEAFNASFVELTQNLTSATGVQIAFVTMRAARGTDKLVQAETLKKLNPVVMDNPRHTQCLSGTRVDLLQEITDWILAPTYQENILWLHGMAGCGKSTVSKTIAQSFGDVHRRGAYLFFERGKADPQSVFRTLASQLASFDDTIRASICAHLDGDSSQGMGLTSDYNHLIAGPLTASSENSQGPIVIVFDALDECGDAETRRELISIIAEQFAGLPHNFRFLITSRPELDIESAFEGVAHIRPISLDNATHNSTNDVRTFFQHELVWIRKLQKLPHDWPPRGSLHTLVDSAGGLFIWASTATSLLRETEDPVETLESLISPGSCGLDALYAKTLQSAISWDKAKSKDRFVAVMAFILLGRIPLSAEDMDEVLGLPTTPALSRLRSLLVVRPGLPVQLVHASFGDYLADPARSGGRPWHIGSTEAQAYLTARCFQVMKTNLRFNICALETSHLANYQVHDLEERAERCISNALKYSCRFWADHLGQSPGNSVRLLEELMQLLDRSFLFWVEVLSLLGEVSTTFRAIDSAITWISIRDPETSSFLRDARRFMSRFSVIIALCTPSIYLSGLPFTPQCSSLRQRYISRFPNLIQLEIGLPDQWSNQDYSTRHTWGAIPSFDGSKVYSISESGKLKVQDTATGAVSYPASGWFSSDCIREVSPDARRIAVDEEGGIDIYDTETWVVVHTIQHIHRPGRLAFTENASHVAFTFSQTRIHVWDMETDISLEIAVEDTTPCVGELRISPQNHVLYGNGGTIRIWDLLGQLIHSFTPTSFSLANFVCHGARILWCSVEGEIGVWDETTGEDVMRTSLSHPGGVGWTQSSHLAFSRDASHVAVSEDTQIHLLVAATGEYLGFFDDVEAGTINFVVFVGTGLQLCSGSHHKATTTVWQEGAHEHPSDQRNRFIFSSAGDGKSVAGMLIDGSFAVWESETEVTRYLEFDSDAHHISISNDATTSLTNHRQWDFDYHTSTCDWGKEPAEQWSFVGDRSYRLSDGPLAMLTGVDPTAQVASLRILGPTLRLLSLPARVLGSSISPVHRVFTRDCRRIAVRLEVPEEELADVILVTEVDVLCAGQLYLEPAEKERPCSIGGYWHRHVYSNGVRLGWLLGTFRGDPPGFQLGFSADGKQLFVMVFTPTTESNSSDGRLHLNAFDVEPVATLDAETCSPRCKASNVSDELWSVPAHIPGFSVSADGSYIISMHDVTRSVMLWDAHTLKNIDSMRHFFTPYNAPGFVTFTPDAPSSKHFTVTNGGFVRLCAFDRIVESEPDGWQLQIQWGAESDEGWILGKDGEYLVWVPPDNQAGLWGPKDLSVMPSGKSTKLDFSKFVHGKEWTKCYAA